MTTSFDSFGLRPDILQGVKALGFTTPTPVQENAIPVILTGRDTIALARTGSGKTLAFGLPLLHMLKPGRFPQALIVAPTRELANQIAEALNSVQPKGGLKIMPIYGGVGLGPQEAALRRGVDIIVGTPGRLKDLLGRGTLDLKHVTKLVLDEADEMLDMGFRRDIDHLLERLPKREQTLIFSATMPETIEVIAHKHLNDPVRLQLVATDETPNEIEHFFVRMGADERTDVLIKLLRGEDPTRALIFTKMKHETKRLAEKLQKQAGINAGYLNGNMSQNARNSMMQRFRDGDFKYLVATDVAARGIDVDGLSHVIHYAVPTVVETYVHRSGRTGRAGASGMTITFVTPDAEADFKAIRKRIMVRPFPSLSPTAPEPDDDEPMAAPAGRAARPGHRGQGKRAPEAVEASAAGGPRDPGALRGERPGRKRDDHPDVLPPRRGRGQAQADGRWAGPATDAPASDKPWRRFRMALQAGHRHSPDTYAVWLAKHTGIARASFRSVDIHDEHASFEVAGTDVETLLRTLKLKGK